MKIIQNNFMEGIGNTPLIKLKGPSELTGCNIYGKAEYLNPGGSIKDRAAWALIKDAEEKKLISKGGTIVEGTAGNTGIGLCLVGNARGYKSIIVMPETQSEEKKNTLRNMGADLRLVPAKPYKDPNNYVKYSERLAKELKSSNNKGVIWANQFDNIVNTEAHIKTTAEEIWHDTDGMVDILVGGVGLATATNQMAALTSIALISNGISTLLSEPPEYPEQRQIVNPSSDPTQLANSYLFSGPVNVINEGGPVPIGYGRLIVGSQVIMSTYGTRKLLVREAGKLR